MIGIFLLAVIGLLITTYGLFLIINPTLVTKAENSISRFFQGSNRWFELSTSVYEKKSVTLRARLAGCFALWIGLVWLYSLLRSVGREGSRPGITGKEPAAPQASRGSWLADRGVFILLIGIGIWVVIWPDRAIATLGLKKYLEVVPPEWALRVFGAAMIAIGVIGILGI